MSPAIQNISQIKKLINLAKGVKNPTAFLQSEIEKMPGYKKALDYVNTHGGDSIKALEHLAQEKGIDVNQIMSMLH